MQKKNNISFKIIEPKKKEFVIKSYADNFLKNQLCGVVFLKIKNGISGLMAEDFLY